MKRTASQPAPVDFNKVIFRSQSIPAFYPVEVTSTSPVSLDFIRVFQPFQFLNNIVPASLTDHLGIAQSQYRCFFRGQHFGERALQDIGFDHINPSILIGEIFLDDTGKFAVCNNSGSLPVSACQHLIFKSILIWLNLSDKSRHQNTML